MTSNELIRRYEDEIKLMDENIAMALCFLDKKIVDAVPRESRMQHLAWFNLAKQRAEERKVDFIHFIRDLKALDPG